jgi:hypothetical protein
MASKLIRAPFQLQDLIDPNLQRLNIWKQTIEDEVDRLGGFQGTATMQNNVINGVVNSKNPPGNEVVTFASLPAASSASPTAYPLKGQQLTPDGTTQDFVLSSAPTGIVIVVWKGAVQDLDQSTVNGVALHTVFTAAAMDSLLAIWN